MPDGSACFPSIFQRRHAARACNERIAPAIEHAFETRLLERQARRILGFAREMVFARIMGATAAAEVFIWAFQLPNLLRRLLGEGAFSQGFVPLFARRIGKDGDLADARNFAEEVQAVFLPVLILITLLFLVAMPLVVVAVASERWTNDPDKFAFTVFLTRITFPYLIFISLVSLFSGILNSLSRFFAAAFAVTRLAALCAIGLLLGAFLAFLDATPGLRSAIAHLGRFGFIPRMDNAAAVGGAGTSIPRPRKPLFRVPRRCRCRTYPRSRLALPTPRGPVNK